jgi:magnesium transporter
MIVYKVAGGSAVGMPSLPPDVQGEKLFVICSAAEVHELVGIFGWDESAVLECANLDETVRHTDYKGYDFTSLVYMEPVGGGVSQQEINLFFSKNYLIIVLPDEAGASLAKLTGTLRRAAEYAAIRAQPLAYLHHFVFDSILTDFAGILESLEDEIETLAEEIVTNPDHRQIDEIGRLRKTAYTYKKLLRAQSYIGSQILLDENKLHDGDNMRYFRDINARMMKQYDLAESLYALSNDLLHTYDSKFSVQMNKSVNKLTVITLFFAPLTFIAGIYGMNFVYMPELGWKLGYPAALVLMAAVCVVLFAIMKKNKWM